MKSINYLAVLGLLSGIGLLGCGGADDGPSEGPPAVAAVNLPADSIAVAQTRTVNPSFEYPAVVEALQKARVRPEVSAVLRKIHFSPGQMVEEGDLLLEFDDSQYRAAHEAAQADLQAAKAKLYGMNFHEVSRHEAERLHPLVNFHDIRCIMWEPDGGNVDPSGVTNAYAAGARKAGAEIIRFCPVTGTERQPDGTWIVRTPKGDIATEWLVNAAGLWGREVAAMAGIDLPLQPTEHQYFVTETIPEIAALGRRLPSVADRDG